MYKDMVNKHPKLLKTVPFKHQEEALYTCNGREYYAYFMEMGTGKTKVILDEAAILFMAGKITGLIVFAPKGAYVNWVTDQIPKHLSEEIPHRLFIWNSGARTKEREEFAKVRKPIPGTLDILVMNIEACSMGRGSEEALAFITTRKGDILTVVDESTTIKNHKALRSKALYKLGGMSKYRRIMTGAPVTQSPLDLFGQCHFLMKGVLGHTSYFSFRATYAEMQIMRFGPRSFPKIVGYRNLEQLKRTLSRFAFRITKEEALDLPDKIYETRNLELTSEQVAIFNKLKNEALVQFESGEVLSITSALTMFTKLHAVLCGHVKDDDGNVHDIPNNRVNALLETVEEMGGKVIVWCNFQQDVRQAVMGLAKEYGENSVVAYYGPSTTDQRANALDLFRNDPECRFFVATSKCGGWGLNLQFCHNVIYYSNAFSLEQRLQSEDRAHRSGQKNNVLYVDLVVPNSLDEKISQVLAQKKEFADMVMTGWEDLLI